MPAACSRCIASDPARRQSEVRMNWAAVARRSSSASAGGNDLPRAASLAATAGSTFHRLQSPSTAGHSPAASISLVAALAASGGEASSRITRCLKDDEDKAMDMRRVG
jgi:hypothetical protein